MKMLGLSHLRSFKVMAPWIDRIAYELLFIMHVWPYLVSFSKESEISQCCKGEDASQWTEWRSPKFDPSRRRNPISGSHKNRQRWLRCGPLHLCKSSSRAAQGFCFPFARQIAHQKVLVFGGFLQLATAKAPSGRILTQYTPKLAVLRKDVPFRGLEHKI